EKLQQEITDLRRKDAELEQLSQTEDHTQFLQNYPELSNLTVRKDSSRIYIRPVRYFEDLTTAVSEARDKLQDFLPDVWTKISETEVDVLLPQPLSKTRDKLLKYSHEITLDPNTAHRWLSLSASNRKVTMIQNPVIRIKMMYFLESDPNIDIHSLQVLSRESLTGRCYWEVEWRGRSVSVAVTYGCMSRPVSESEFGNDDTSWGLYYYSDHYEFRHKDIRTRVSGPQSSRVGVYLDHSAGILCFYSVSETMALLHRVQTTFTQPLYAGLGFYHGICAAELCELK
ncbi:tripartite motif-containing protein 16-like protein, partial [Plectropomus leopardus]|uniref:tripartite motif-containing protein 16-like protein n=1 Tax=Plectropomus leopardus TaxID=160734 RepID=UPI001C4BF3B2